MSHWREQKETGSQFMRRMLVWIALHLGRPLVQAVLYPTVFYFMLFAKQPRAASRDYLQRVLGRSPTWREQFRHFLYFATCSIDRLYFLSGKTSAIHTDIHDLQVFDTYRQQGRGALLMITHTGNFDVMRAVGVRIHQQPVKILLSRSQNAGANSLFEQLDPEFAKQIIDADRPANELVLEIQQALNEGYFVGVMADRAGLQDKTILCDFFGSPAAFPAYPWLISMVLKAPVILCFAFYQGRASYQVHFELFSEGAAVARKQRDEHIARQAQQFAARLQHWMKQYPYNWFNFYPFWQHDSSRT